MGMGDGWSSLRPISGSDDRGHVFGFFTCRLMGARAFMHSESIGLMLTFSRTVGRGLVGSVEGRGRGRCLSVMSTTAEREKGPGSP